MSYREVMNLPISVFWFMNYTINRIRAEADIRSLSLQAHAQSAEGQAEFRKHLTLEMGEVVTQSPVISTQRDEEGFEALRAMAKLGM